MKKSRILSESEAWQKLAKWLSDWQYVADHIVAFGPRRHLGLCTAIRAMHSGRRISAKTAGDMMAAIARERDRRYRGGVYMWGLTRQGIIGRRAFCRKQAVLSRRRQSRKKTLGRKRLRSNQRKWRMDTDKQLDELAAWRLLAEWLGDRGTYRQRCFGSVVFGPARSVGLCEAIKDLLARRRISHSIATRMLFTIEKEAARLGCAYGYIWSSTVRGHQARRRFCLKIAAQLAEQQKKIAHASKKNGAKSRKRKKVLRG